MARPLRIYLPGAWHHLTACARGNTVLVPETLCWPNAFRISTALKSAAVVSGGCMTRCLTMDWTSRFSAAIPAIFRSLFPAPARTSNASVCPRSASWSPLQ